MIDVCSVFVKNGYINLKNLIGGKYETKSNYTHNRIISSDGMCQAGKLYCFGSWG